MNENSKKISIFDLDGTLADTAPDLANALNQVLKNHNKPTLPYEKIRPIVSNGGAALITLGFHITPDDPEFEALKNELLDIYRGNIAVETTLFLGMTELLSELEAQKIKWGIVTNKPGWLTKPLLDALNLTDKASSVVSGDTLHVKKPNPKPLLLACQQAGSEVNECVYVGDAERDILAGSRAIMRTAVALFGYIEESDNPESWGADTMLHTPLDLLAWIEKINMVERLQSMKKVG